MGSLVTQSARRLSAPVRSTDSVRSRCRCCNEERCAEIQAVHAAARACLSASRSSALPRVWTKSEQISESQYSSTSVSSRVCRHGKRWASTLFICVAMMRGSPSSAGSTKRLSTQDGSGMLKRLHGCRRHSGSIGSAPSSMKKRAPYRPSRWNPRTTLPRGGGDGIALEPSELARNSPSELTTTTDRYRSGWAKMLARQ